MLKNRIIPCLDVKNGRVVKGINFVNLKDRLFTAVKNKDRSRHLTRLSKTPLAKTMFGIFSESFNSIGSPVRACACSKQPNATAHANTSASATDLMVLCRRIIGLGINIFIAEFRGPSALDQLCANDGSLVKYDYRNR